MTDRRYKLGCCFAMVQAQQHGTENEGYGPLLRPNVDDELAMGHDLPPIIFCPWCGKKIEKKL